MHQKVAIRNPAVTLAALFLLLLWSVPGVSHASEQVEFKGTVNSSAGNPKAYIRVEINSPENTVFTSKTGEFTAKLAPGTYTLKFIEGRKTQRFTVTIPSAETNKAFNLKW